MALTVPLMRSSNWVGGKRKVPQLGPKRRFRPRLEKNEKAVQEKRAHTSKTARDRYCLLNRGQQRLDPTMGKEMLSLPRSKARRKKQT